MNNLWNLIPSLLTLVAGGGWLFDRRRHRQEVESLRADNRQKDMNLSKMYVNEFRENIADPLRHEVREPDTADVRHRAVGLDLQSRPIEYKDFQSAWQQCTP